MYRYMNRFTYSVSTLSMQLITKLSKMNRFTVLESQNRLSTNPYLANTHLIRNWREELTRSALSREGVAVENELGPAAGLEGLEGGVALVAAVVVPVLPAAGEAARPVAAGPHRRGGDLVARG